jgi:hypothetical protein
VPKQLKMKRSGNCTVRFASSKIPGMGFFKVPLSRRTNAGHKPFTTHGGSAGSKQEY